MECQIKNIDKDNEEILNDISKLQSGFFQHVSDNIQDFTSDMFENMQRKFMELNWFPLSARIEGFSNNRVSYQKEQFKKKQNEKQILDNVFLTSFGIFGIYLFYKMLEKTNAVPE